MSARSGIARHFAKVELDDRSVSNPLQRLFCNLSTIASKLEEASLP